jgi:hypothetical protein
MQSKGEDDAKCNEVAEGKKKLIGEIERST